MEASSLAFLKRLLDSPGPSGFETAPARAWREEAEGFAAGVRADVAGNSYAAVNPDGTPKVMFAGHIDEIGLMVLHVDDDGFLFFSTIGGWDPQVLVGQRVRILTRNGNVPGVIGKRAIHLVKQEDRSKVSKPIDLWIDIGAHGRLPESDTTIIAANLPTRKASAGPQTTARGKLRTQSYRVCSSREAKISRRITGTARSSDSRVGRRALQGNREAVFPVISWVARRSGPPDLYNPNDRLAIAPRRGPI